MADPYTSKSGTYRVEGAGANELKSRMKHISGGLDALRTKISAEAHHIDELRGMFDVSYLNELMAMMEDLEGRVTGMESELNTAIVDSDKHRKQLSAEQERLAKLWEAYKKQEDDLNALKWQIGEMNQAIGEKNSSIAELDSQVKSLERLKELAAYKEKYESLVRQYSQIEDYSSQQAQRISELENYTKQLEPLKEYAQFKDRAEAVGKDLELEKERLAKLYKVYEDTDAHLRTARAELDAWNAWFLQYEHLFGGVGEAAHLRKPFVRRPEMTAKKTFEK